MTFGPCYSFADFRFFFPLKLSLGLILLFRLFLLENVPEHLVYWFLQRSHCLAQEADSDVSGARKLTGLVPGHMGNVANWRAPATSDRGNPLQLRWLWPSGVRDFSLLTFQEMPEIWIFMWNFKILAQFLKSPWWPSRAWLRTTISLQEISHDLYLRLSFLYGTTEMWNINILKRPSCFV